jgi:hypothetical protein
MTLSPSEVISKAPKTWRDHAKNLTGAAALVLFTLLLIEVLLRAVDPWGLYYFQDLEQLGNVIFQPDPVRGYIIPDGEYTFTRWKAEVRNGGRVVPATYSDSACTIAILGDSVAFGYGVNDGDTWLNVAAREFPDVQFMDLGVPRYNSTNVVGTWKAYPNADAYVYLIISNDLEPALDIKNERFAGGGTGQPWIVRYTNFALKRGGGTDQAELQVQPDTEAAPPLPDDYPGLARFWDEVQELHIDEGVYFVAFEKEPLTSTLLARDLPLTTWSYPFKRRISLADYHLNPTGNEELAAQALPLLRQIAQDRCESDQS